MMNTTIMVATTVFLAALFGGGWSQSCMRNETCFGMAKEMRIEEIKNHILHELGLRHPPQLDESKLPSEEMRREYQRMAEEEMMLMEESEGIEGLLIPAEDPWQGEDQSSLVASFNLKGQDLGFYQLHESKVSFYVRLDNPNGRQKVDIQVYEKNEDGTMGDLIATDEQFISESKRVHIKLPRDEVARWIESESHSQGIFVSATVNGVNMALHPQQTSNDHENMILQVSIKPKNRKRRSVKAVCDAKSEDKGCCLYDLVIDFHAIGWTWIIQPKAYNAFICRGSCSTNDGSYKFADFGHHKIVKTAESKSTVAAEVIRKSQSCCHPTGYDSIRVVYIGEKNHISSAVVNGMIATRCSCS